MVFSVIKYVNYLTRLINIMSSKHFLILVLFSSLSVLFTYPLILNLHASITGIGDPLLNSWILAWDVHSLFHNPFGIFNANIFYPYKNTLAYSEPMFINAVIASPMLLITGNPILSHNFILLFSLTFSGFAMYLYVVYLTNNKCAGIIAGIIFAYNPYMFTHLQRIQLLGTGWIPLTFLYVHKFFSERQRKDLFLVFLFFVCGAINCAYYMLFLSFFLIIFICYIIISEKLFQPRYLYGTLIGVVSTLLIILPFYIPHFVVKNEMGFTRELWEANAFSADMLSYFGASPPKTSEDVLFPGFLPFILGFVGVINFNGGSSLTEKPKKYKGYYLITLIMAFLLSLGPTIHFGGKPLFEGPYYLFHNYVPGFNGIRAPARFGVFFMFSLAILSGYGLNSFALLSNRKWYKVYFTKVIFLLFSSVIMIKFLSVPIPLVKMKVGDEIPPVYQYLKNIKEDLTILEYPIEQGWPQWQDSIRIYYSTYHWKRLVNGYSGYTSPLYWNSRIKMETEFPSRETIGLLKLIRVDYIIIHGAELVNGRGKGISDKIKQWDSDLKLVDIFGNDYLYKLSELAIEDTTILDIDANWNDSDSFLLVIRNNGTIPVVFLPKTKASVSIYENKNKKKSENILLEMPTILWPGEEVKAPIGKDISPCNNCEFSITIKNPILGTNYKFSKIFNKKAFTTNL